MDQIVVSNDQRALVFLQLSAFSDTELIMQDLLRKLLLSQFVVYYTLLQKLINRTRDCDFVYIISFMLATRV